jgi:phospholipid/cholesterol/gamma-HCH transport system substrate-binding protein
MQSSRALREGRLGLFALVGLLVFGALTIWIRGGGLGQKTYQLIIEFSNVEGLQVGAAVRYRGVRVGRIVNFIPKSNKVEVIAEIASTDLIMPRDVTIAINRSGLIGEAAIDITPLVDLSANAKNFDPLSPDCDQQQILCNNARLEGKSGDQLMSSISRLVDTFTAPEFVGNLNDVTKNTAVAAQKIASLSDETKLTIRNAQRELSRLSLELATTSRSVTNTANSASRFVNNLNSTVQENRGQITKTFEQSTQLVANINSIFSENRGQIVNTLDNINRASAGLGTLTATLNTTALKLNYNLDAIDTKKVMQNLETILNNAIATSNNLREVTQTINDPATIVVLQKTLESARVTFENTQKITSDIDELIGDPQFRENLRRLIEGLSSLLSFGEQLEYNLRIAQTLDTMTQELANQKVLQISPRLNPRQLQLYPKVIVQQPQVITEEQQSTP